MSVLSRVSEKRISRGVVLRFSFLLGPPFRVQASRVESASRRSGWVPGRGHTNLRTRPGFSPWGQRPMEGQTNDEALPQVWRWPEGSWDCLKQIVAPVATTSDSVAVRGGGRRAFCCHDTRQRGAIAGD